MEGAKAVGKAKAMEEVMKEFKKQDIRVLEPGQLEYEKAIATSNFLFRFSRPG